MKYIGKILKVIFVLIVSIIVLLLLFSFKKQPENITYGVSFSKFHSDELRLPWKEVYSAVLNDLGVRELRLSTHWPMIEPEQDKFNFSEFDYQMDRAREVDAKVVLAVGRRLPGWPECHEPAWVNGFSKQDKEREILEYIEAVVNRYKDYPNILYWQVENEPFLTFFSKHACGEFDPDFLKAEIELVRKLDPNHKILVTDSGEISTWHNAYNSGDAFGTSVYLYVWTHYFGPIRYPIVPGFFRAKQNIIHLLYGQKPTFLIELSLEPWLLQPIADTPMETILDRMSIEKFNETIEFAQKSSFDKQYFWGAEWWYWMKEKGHDEYWKKAKEIFNSGSSR